MDFSKLNSQITNVSFNQGDPNYVEEWNKTQAPDSELPFSSYMHMSTAWKYIERDYPEANIEEMKEKMSKLVKMSLRALRPAVEVQGAERIDINMYPDMNDRTYQIYAYDVMFDTDYEIHMFEANRSPFFCPFNTKTTDDGQILKLESATYAENVKAICSDALRIVILKQEPHIIKKCYDSSEGDDANFVYEKVTKVYREVCGKPLRNNLTCDLLYEKLPKLVSQEINLSEVFKQMNTFRGVPCRFILLYDFFNMLLLLSRQLSITMDDLLDKMLGSIINQ